jgi:hypothetical protein
MGNLESANWVMGNPMEEHGNRKLAAIPQPGKLRNS